MIRVGNFCGRRWTRHIAVLIISVLYMSTQPVMIESAHQSPGSCNANRLNISIIKDRTEVYQGQTINYTVTASNIDFGSDIACDITAADIQITLPAMDGTPTGTVVVLQTNQTLLGNMGQYIVGTVPYVVNVNPNVIDIVAEARAEGVLHDAPVDHSALIVKTVGTSVVAPPSTGGGSGGGGSSTPTTTPGLPNTGTARHP